MLKWLRRRPEVAPAGDGVHKRIHLFESGLATDISYDISATQHFIDAYEPLAARGRTRLDVELVPEPDNSFDHWAVAVHMDGRKAGFIGAHQAAWWHDVIAGLNRSGTGVVTAARIEEWGPEPLVYIALPKWEQRLALATDLGLIGQVEQVLRALPTDVLDDLLGRAFDPLTSQDAEALYSVAHLAPSLSWNRGTHYGSPDPGTPSPYFSHTLREWLLERREQARVEREARALERKREREEQRRAAEERREQAARQREKDRAQALDLWNQGLSMAAIARELGCSGSKVSALLREAGAPPRSPAVHGENEANVRARQERLERCRTVLTMQREGATRRQIGEALGLSMDSVKMLLRDARFYEDPTTNPQRYEQVKRCAELRRQGWTREQVGAELEVSEKSAKSLVRDAEILFP